MVTAELTVTVAVLGFVGAYFSGLVGVGGAVVLVPLLIYVPEWLGVGLLDIKASAAIAVTGVVFGTASATLAHARHQAVSRSLAVLLSVTTLVAAFGAGALSKLVDSGWLLMLFAVVVTGAGVLTLLPAPLVEAGVTALDLRFNRPLATAIGLFAGIVIGFLGAGAFMLIPLVRYLLRVPMKIAIGTILVVAFFSALGSFGGKLITGQVPWLAIAAVLGAVPGAQVGSWMSQKLPGPTLRRLYTVLIACLAIGAWYDVLHVR